ncbi:MAG: hypothetical protein UV05_C0003G0011 [candidate division CPR1 bacterium GW2011_GWA2_42_17]|uniref:Uncharacterized protein n=1 Tax=candidate division CPR1 bacterium GW2011_GWA2_42_17 TaxID=1618341 RepID=A0A0G0Z7N8_9BACT|nr:MAG: hypothetical protein UV05_C0003G0011 [candidate division CPR1 bacterium GW2011_GWA2_42_17]
MKKVSKFVWSAILNGAIWFTICAITIYLFVKFLHLSNFIVGLIAKIPLLGSIVSLPTPSLIQTFLNAIIFLFILFIIGLVALFSKKFLALSQILALLPIIGPFIRYARKNPAIFVCESGIATNMKGSTFSPIITYEGKTWIPAFITGRVCCKSGEKFKILAVPFHNPFKYELVDSDTKILAALPWNSFLKYWPVGGMLDVPEMENLEEYSIKEYCDEIHPKK